MGICELKYRTGWGELFKDKLPQPNSPLGLFLGPAWSEEKSETVSSWSSFGNLVRTARKDWPEVEHRHTLKSRKSHQSILNLQGQKQSSIINQRELVSYFEWTWLAKWIWFIAPKTGTLFSEKLKGLESFVLRPTLFFYWSTWPRFWALKKQYIYCSADWRENTREPGLSSKFSISMFVSRPSTQIYNKER